MLSSKLNLGPNAHITHTHQASTTCDEKMRSWSDKPQLISNKVISQSSSQIIALNGECLQSRWILTDMVVNVLLPLTSSTTFHTSNTDNLLIMLQVVGICYKKAVGNYTSTFIYLEYKMRLDCWMLLLIKKIYGEFNKIIRS